MTTDNLKFTDCKGNVSLEMLNKEYGDYGVTVKTTSEAYAMKEANAGSEIYRIVNYKDHEVVTACPPFIKDGAIPHTQAYLVTPLTKKGK